MGNISHKSVFNVIQCLDVLCDCKESDPNCLVCVAKSFLIKFNKIQRKIDIGPLRVSFPENKRAFDKEKVKACYERVKSLCDDCYEYHSEKCQVLHTRNALELIFFGAKLPVMRMSYAHFLLEQKVVTKDQIDEALTIFHEMNPSIGSFAFARGYLTQKHVMQILSQQKDTTELFGQAAKKIALLTDFQIESILEFQKVNKVKLSEVLMALGYLDEDINRQLYEKYLEYYNLTKKEEEEQ